MEFKALPGVFDIIPFDSKELWKSSFLWTWVETNMRDLASTYVLQEIRTPVIEKTELFCRVVGETSDIVTKEMYSFIDRGERSITLRPEGTAPVIRAYLEHHLGEKQVEQRLFYLSPMFRYERSQAGRYRQHHQIGVEIIGSKAPETDAELIDIAYTLYKKIGINHLSIAINSLGNQKSRFQYKIALKDYFNEHFKTLSKESKIRLERNPLRILDSKAPEDRLVIENAPSILEFLDSESRIHFEETTDCLKALNIPFQINPQLVRGLDYYNQTVFEIMSTNLGAQNSIGGGGRYDGLIKNLGGPDIPACGFGTGMERILQALIAQNGNLPEQKKPVLFLIPLSDEAKKFGFILQKNLRQINLPVQMESSGKKLNKAMGIANQSGAKFLAVIGDNELTSHVFTLKDMQSGTLNQVSFDNLQNFLIDKLI